jgi:protein CpxP
MKKGIIAILLAFVTMGAFAQRQGPGGTPEERAKMQTASLTESLKLTKEQQKQVYTINLERATKMQEMRNLQNQDREAMKTAMQAYETELEKILTPEQLKKHQTDLAERRKNGPKRNVNQ